MRQSDRVKLHFGPYRKPRYKLGQVVQCAIRGKVVIVSTSKGRIPWPRCRPHIGHVLIIYGGLEKAIRRESTYAVAHWFGVTTATVGNWRRALGVGQYNAGTVKLRKEGYADPARSKRMSASKRGKPRLPEVRGREMIRTALKRYNGK